MATIIKQYPPQSWGGLGDMQSIVYDPTNVNADAFDMDNMNEGLVNKILTDPLKTGLELGLGTWFITTQWISATPWTTQGTLGAAKYVVKELDANWNVTYTTVVFPETTITPDGLWVSEFTYVMWDKNWNILQYISPPSAELFYTQVYFGKFVHFQKSATITAPAVVDVQWMARTFEENIRIWTEGSRNLTWKSIDFAPAWASAWQFQLGGAVYSSLWRFRSDNPNSPNIWDVPALTYGQAPALSTRTRSTATPWEAQVDTWITALITNQIDNWDWTLTTIAGGQWSNQYLVLFPKTNGLSIVPWRTQHATELWARWVRWKKEDLFLFEILIDSALIWAITVQANDTALTNADFEPLEKFGQIVTIGGWSGAGEANTASNLGDGEWLFAWKVWFDLTFKSLWSSDWSIIYSADWNKVNTTIDQSKINTSQLNNDAWFSAGWATDVTVTATGDIQVWDAIVYSKESSYDFANTTRWLRDTINTASSVYWVTTSIDWKNLYIISLGTDSVTQYELLIPFAPSSGTLLQTFSVSWQESSPSEVRFKTDGTKMYMLGLATDSVHQYTLSTAWDISTAVYDNVSFSVSSEESTPYWLDFKDDGTKMFVSGQSGRQVREYTLTTAWDISTASFTATSWNLYLENNDQVYPVSLSFTQDWKILYTNATNTNPDYILAYSLDEPWDITTLNAWVSDVPLLQISNADLLYVDDTLFWLKVSPSGDRVLFTNTSENLVDQFYIPSVQAGYTAWGSNKNTDFVWIAKTAAADGESFTLTIWGEATTKSNLELWASAYLATAWEIQSTSTQTQLRVWQNATNQNTQSQQMIIGAKDVTEIVVNIYKQWAPTDDLVVRIETDNNWQPSWTLADINATASISWTAITTTASPYKLTFWASFDLSVWTYWLVFSRSWAIDGTNYFWTKYTSTISYLPYNFWDLIANEVRYQNRSLYFGLIDSTWNVVRSTGVLTPNQTIKRVGLASSANKIYVPWISAKDLWSKTADWFDSGGEDVISKTLALNFRVNHFNKEVEIWAANNILSIWTWLWAWSWINNDWGNSVYIWEVVKALWIVAWGNVFIWDGAKSRASTTNDSVSIWQNASTDTGWVAIWKDTFNESSEGLSLVEQARASLRWAAIWYNTEWNSNAYSWVKWYQSRAENYGDEVRQISTFSNQPNIAKYVDNWYYASLSNNTQTEIFLMWWSGNRYNLIARSLVRFNLRCNMYLSSSHIAKVIDITGTIKRDDLNNVTLLESVKANRVAEVGTESWDIIVSADATNGALKVEAIWNATDTTLVACKLETIECKF